MDEATKAAVFSAIIGGLIALLVAKITAQQQIKMELKKIELENRAEQEREREKKRIQYLNPLRVYAQDLLDKITNMQKELPNKGDLFQKNFREIKGNDRNNKEQFSLWCNGEGAGAVTALYITAVYFAYAKKIRSDIPFIQLSPQEDKNLLDYLNNVRAAFGGEYNLWVEVQDSLGTYVTNQDGSIMNYKGFCLQLIDHWDHIWFTRLIDFYKDFHMKTDYELPRITETLHKLIVFLDKDSLHTTKYTVIKEGM